MINLLYYLELFKLDFGDIAEEDEEVDQRRRDVRRSGELPAPFLAFCFPKFRRFIGFDLS